MTTVAVVDYGVGNLHSVAKALQAAGAVVEVTGDVDRLRAADGVVLPGVGAFAAAQAEIERRAFREVIEGLAAAGRPLLGVCLGYQLLFETSHEQGTHRGLGLLRGTVERFSDDVRVPHTGWNQVHVESSHPLMADIPGGSWFYFVHSFRPEATVPDVVATADHGGRFAAAAARGNVWGTQFHPEKSGATGLRVYQNFVNQCGRA